jgi:hypothetical protein
MEGIESTTATPAVQSTKIVPSPGLTISQTPIKFKPPPPRSYTKSNLNKSEGVVKNDGFGDILDEV